MRERIVHDTSDRQYLQNIKARIIPGLLIAFYLPYLCPHISNKILSGVVNPVNRMYIAQG